MARIVNVTIPVESEDEEGLHRFITAMAAAMDRIAREVAPYFGITIPSTIEGEELVPIETVEPMKRDDV